MPGHGHNVENLLRAAERAAQTHYQTPVLKELCDDYGGVMEYTASVGDDLRNASAVAKAICDLGSRYVSFTYYIANARNTNDLSKIRLNMRDDFTVETGEHGSPPDVSVSVKPPIGCFYDDKEGALVCNAVEIHGEGDYPFYHIKPNGEMYVTKEHFAIVRKQFTVRRFSPKTPSQKRAGDSIHAAARKCR